MNKPVLYFLLGALIMPLIVVGAYLGYKDNFAKLPVLGPYERIDGSYKLSTAPHWEFTDQNNELLSSEFLSDKIVVLNFFFTSCPKICPTMNNNVQKVQQVFINDESLDFVSISIDPERDTPQRLKEYEKIFSLKEQQWHFLTGEEKEIFLLASKGYNLTAADASAEGEHEDLIHSQTVLLIDPNQQIRGKYAGTDSESMASIVKDISTLKKEFKL